MQGVTVKDSVKATFLKILNDGHCDLLVDGEIKTVESIDLPITTGESLETGFRINYNDGNFSELWWGRDFEVLAFME